MIRRNLLPLLLLAVPWGRLVAAILGWAVTCPQCGRLSDVDFAGPDYCYDQDSGDWQRDATHDGEIDMIDIAFFQASYPDHPFDAQRDLWTVGVGWPVLDPNGAVR